MAFTSLLALVALAAVSRAAPAAETALCADGTRVSHEACCAFIPVRARFYSTLFRRLIPSHSSLRISRKPSSRVTVAKMVMTFPSQYALVMTLTLFDAQLTKSFG